jgi:hypothetical protein
MLKHHMTKKLCHEISGAHTECGNISVETLKRLTSLNPASCARTI